MWTDQFKIFLITLPGDARTTVAEAELQKYNIPYEIFPAIKDEDGREGLKKTIRLLFEMCDGIFKNIITFEDDIKFVIDPAPVMEKCLQQLKYVYWDLFYLGVNTHRKFDRFYSENLLKITHGFSTHAVAYSEAGRKKIMELDWTGRAIDQILSDHIQVQDNSYCSYPLIATQSDGYSYIEKKDVCQNYIVDRFNEHTKNTKR